MKIKMNNSPQEAQIISLILKTQGISECDPAVIPLLIEYSNHFISDVLKKAEQYNNLINKEEDILTINSINQSIEDIKESYIKIPPNRQYVSEMANSINSRPLKLINDEKVTCATIGRGNVLNTDFN